MVGLVLCSKNHVQTNEVLDFHILVLSKFKQKKYRFYVHTLAAPESLSMMSRSQTVNGYGPKSDWLRKVIQ